MFRVQKGFHVAVLFSVPVIALAFASQAKAQLDVDQGYLDRFDLTDGRHVDIGALGGGLDSDANTHKIFVNQQASSFASDNRLTGVVHGKLRVTNLTDRNSDGFVNGADLDITFDAAWQLIRNNKQPNGASYVSSSLNGPEGTPGPNPTTVNFPHTLGGTGAIWNIASCSTPGGVDVNVVPNAREICDPNSPLLAVGALPGGRYTGFADYTFSISIPGTSDFNPGLGVSNDNWIITALVGVNAAASPAGSISYGRTPTFNPATAVGLAQGTLFGPNQLLNFPGEDANINVATLLSSVEIVVVPEPATLALLALGGLAVIRTRRLRRK